MPSQKTKYTSTGRKQDGKALYSNGCGDLFYKKRKTNNMKKTNKITYKYVKVQSGGSITNIYTGNDLNLEELKLELQNLESRLTMFNTKQPKDNTDLHIINLTNERILIVKDLMRKENNKFLTWRNNSNS
jgi:hypothetical protein